jgi:hypothetical protein
MEINGRYDIVGDRLADRQNELSSTLEKVKSYLQDVQDILTWLEEKECGIVPQEKLPSNVEVAVKQLKEHETFHDELLAKEELVDSIRQKAGQLMKNKGHVPGISDVQQLLEQLGE